MYILSILNEKGQYERIEVPELVHIYVQQLETYINYPEQSKLKEVYKDRFSTKSNNIKELKNTIKNQNDYEDALSMVGSLMGKDPDPESEDGEKLSLLATLIEDYESKEFPMDNTIKTKYK